MVNEENQRSDKIERHGFSREIRERINERFDHEVLSKNVDFIESLFPADEHKTQLYYAVQQRPTDAESLYQWLANGVVLGR